MAHDVTRRRWRIAVGAAILVFGLAAAATFALWPRDDIPRDPDAVVVLGGAGSERAELGIELSERFDALLVLSSSAVDFAEDLDRSCDEEQVVCIEPEPETTAGEARSIGNLTDERGWDHVTVATSRFHSTRARVLFRQCLGDQVSVVGAVRSDGRERGLRTHLEEAIATVAGLTIQRAC